MEAAVELPGQAAACLVGQIVQVELVHQTAGDAHHFAALRFGVVPVARADDADAAMLKALHDGFGLADLAADAVEPFDDQHVEAGRQRVGQKRLAAWPQGERRGAAHRRVAALDDDMPAFGGSPGTGCAQLVFN